MVFWRSSSPSWYWTETACQWRLGRLSGPLACLACLYAQFLLCRHLLGKPPDSHQSGKTGQLSDPVVQYCMVVCDVIYSVYNGVDWQSSHFICACVSVFHRYAFCLSSVSSDGVSYCMWKRNRKAVSIKSPKHYQYHHIFAGSIVWRIFPDCGIYCRRSCILLVDFPGKRQSIKIYYF